MIYAGLTGSIGMGKSTIAAMFKQLGAHVFDADKAVHDMYERGGVAVPIIRAGIPEAVKNNAVDRAALSAALTKDPLLFPVLESFIHPLVKQEREKSYTEAKAAGAGLHISDIPLLFETQAQEEFDCIIVVSAPANVQKARVLARPNMTQEKFEQILARQISDSVKRQRADYVIETGRSMDKSREQVQRLYQRLSS